MARDFFNMMSVFFGIIAFCLVMAFTIGFIKVQRGLGNIESASTFNYKDSSASAFFTESELLNNQASLPIFSESGSLPPVNPHSDYVPVLE